MRLPVSAVFDKEGNLIKAEYADLKPEEVVKKITSGKILKGKEKLC